VRRLGRYAGTIVCHGVLHRISHDVYMLAGMWDVISDGSGPEAWPERMSFDSEEEMLRKIKNMAWIFGYGRSIKYNKIDIL
jgi:hypothetical protein